MTANAKDAMWLIFILIVVGVFWGAQYEGDFSLNFGSDSPRLNPRGGKSSLSPPSISAPSSSSRQTETTENQTSVTRAPISISLAQAKREKPEEEYIVLTNVSQENITISGFQLKNKDGLAVSIGTDQNKNNIELAPREKAIISTRHSPVGYNFKINACSGYFNQTKSFVPGISNSCPRIHTLPQANDLNATCRDTLRSIKSCTMPTSLGVEISPECNNFIREHASYQKCVEDFEGQENFNKGEWRIFLNRQQEFWKQEKEIIRLINSAGDSVVEVAY